MKKVLLSFLIVSSVLTLGIAQSDLDSKALFYAKKSSPELYKMLALPNDAHYFEQGMLNVRWAQSAFEKRGFQVKHLKTTVLPMLLAEKRVKNAAKTVLVYLQMDGQPVDTSKWDQSNPWVPTLKRKNANEKWAEIAWDKLQKDFNKEDRIFVRSASDAKGPVMMLLKAMDWMSDEGQEPNFNLKVILDFEEELGSPRIKKVVETYKKELASDMFVIFDGPRHTSNRPTLTYGARGIVTLTLKVFGPRVPQHSGHYGNYAPNPAYNLSRLLHDMKNSNGKVIIPGWYDGVVLDAATKEILRQVPDDEEEIRRKIGIAGIDAVADNYQEAMQYPSLNILGLQSGWVGNETRTVVPATATAEMDIRLVKESDPERLVGLVQHLIKTRGFHFVNGMPTEAERLEYKKLISFEYDINYGAFRTSFDSEVGAWLRKGMFKAFGSVPIQIRTAGGSIPIAPFVNTLDVPAVSVPTVNPDNNQHSPNENLRLGNYVEGIKTIYAIFTTEI